MNKANIVKYLRVHAIYLDAPVYIVAESIQGYEQLVRPKYKRNKLKINSLFVIAFSYSNTLFRSNWRAGLVNFPLI